MSPRPWLAALALPCVAAGGLYYDPQPYTLPTYDESWRETLQELVERDLARGKLVSVTFAGDVPLAEAPMRSLIVAAHLTKKERGAEAHLLVELKDGERLPVRVSSDASGAFVIEEGPGPVVTLEPIPGDDVIDWNSWLVTSFGVGLQDATAAWTAEEAAHVRASMEVLSPPEQEAMRGIVFVREFGTHGRLQALYDELDGAAVIHVWDTAFGDGKHFFAGPVHRPLPPSLLVLVHEMGHGVAAWVGRVANGLDVGVYYGMRSKQPDQLELDWDLARAGVRGPTSYGRTSISEGFAESFALHHLDPEALARVMPEAAAWFGEGGVERRLAQQKKALLQAGAFDDDEEPEP